MVTRTNPAWGPAGTVEILRYHGLKLGMPGQIPYGIQLGNTGPGKVGMVYHGMKPWAIPYRAGTGLKRGCPCLDNPHCARGAPYQSHTRSDRERYLGGAQGVFISTYGAPLELVTHFLFL